MLSCLEALYMLHRKVNNYYNIYGISDHYRLSIVLVQTIQRYMYDALLANCVGPVRVIGCILSSDSARILCNHARNNGAHYQSLSHCRSTLKL